MNHAITVTVSGPVRSGTSTIAKIIEEALLMHFNKGIELIDSPGDKPIPSEEISDRVRALQGVGIAIRVQRESPRAKVPYQSTHGY